MSYLEIRINRMHRNVMRIRIIVHLKNMKKSEKSEKIKNFCKFSGTSIAPIYYFWLAFTGGNVFNFILLDLYKAKEKMNS